MTQLADTIMSRLKAATDDLHQAAETRPLQKALVKGTLPRERYAAFLGQMFLVHRALESRLAAVADRHRAFAAVVRDHQRREPQLRDDLAFLGVEAEATTPVPATRRFLDLIERAGDDDPVALLGMLYVLEGSTNGARFIAAALTRAWGLEPGPGLSYWDPYGDRQKELWSTFKQDMNGVGFSEGEAASLIEAARATFRAVSGISDDLYEPEPVAV